MLSVYVADLNEYTDLEGPGYRIAIWFAGCSIRCKSCCNPHLFERNSNQKMSLENLITTLERTIFRYPDLEGISLLGGEPLDQPNAVYEILKFTNSKGLSSMLYTGFTLDQIKNSEFSRILDELDLLVDGPYVASKKEFNRRWIGSSNQNLYFLSDRYNPGMDCFDKSNELELRLKNGELKIYGFPSDFTRELMSTTSKKVVLNLQLQEDCDQEN